MALEDDPVDAVWPRKPPLPIAPIQPHPERFAGRSSAAKRMEVAELLARAGVDAAVISDPASIAWLLNVRGADVPHTPLPLSFAVLEASGDVDRTDRPLDARSGNDARLLKSGGRSCNPRYDAERLRGSWHPGAKPDRFNAMQLGQKFGYPLATLGFSVLRDVANELGLPLTQLEAFCLAVDLYMPKNDYHNRLHVADVVQLMHLQCSEGGELNACLTITNLDRHISLT